MRSCSSSLKAVCVFTCGCLLALLAFCTSAYSQTSNGRILGTVNDQTGGSIVGAMVTVVDVQRGSERSLTSDESGAFFAPNLIPGIYTVRVQYVGFRQFERQNILVEVGKDVAVDVVLQP